MLDAGREDVSLFRVCAQGAVNRGIVTFGSAAREDYLSGICVYEGGDFCAGIFKVFRQLMAEMICTRGIPPIFAQEWQHRIENLWRDAGRGVVIKVIYRLLGHSWTQYARKTIFCEPKCALVTEGQERVDTRITLRGVRSNAQFTSRIFASTRRLIISFTDTWMCRQAWPNCVVKSQAGHHSNQTKTIGTAGGISPKSRCLK